MECCKLHRTGGVQPGDVDCGSLSWAGWMGREDHRDGYLTAGDRLCAEGKIPAAGGEPRLARADAAEVHGARRGRVGGVRAGSLDVRFSICESVYDLAEAAGIRSGIAEERAAVFSATRPEAAVSGCLSADGAGWVSDTGKCGAGGGFVGSFRGGVRFELLFLSSTIEIAAKVA